MKYIELDIEIGELFSKLGLDSNIYNTELYSELNIQVQTPEFGWVDVNSFVKKSNLPMIQLTLENGNILKVAEKHILQHNKQDIFAVDALYIDTEYGSKKIIAKEYFGIHDAYDISIPSPHLYYDSYGTIHHNTEGVEQACAIAKRELVACNVTNETTEEDLMGSFILSNGNMIWKDGPVLVAMRRGAVLLLDELDQITSTCMSLQSVLQNKPYYVKKTNEMVYPKPGFTIVGTANTKGDGDSGDRYVGANVLNEAFLERFNCVYEQDYPPSKVEMKILSKLCTDTNFLVGLVRWAGNIRENYKLNTISRCITTRRLVQIVRNYAVFQSQKSAIEYGINRFDKDTRSAMMDYYNNINNITYNDGLDEYLPKDAIRDTAISDEIENAVTESVAKTVKVNMNFGNPSIKEIASAMKAPTQKSDDYYNKLYNGAFNLPPEATKASVDKVDHLKTLYGNHDTSEKTINKAIDGLNRFNSEYLNSPYEDEHPSYKGTLWSNGRPI